MGTSASNRGPSSAVPFDPPWLEEIEIPNIPPPVQSDGDEDQTTETQSDKLSPSARFGNARRNLSDYVVSGDRGSLRRALGHYSKTGMGGSRKLSNRLKLSSIVAAGLFSALQSLSEGNNEPLSTVIAQLLKNDAGIYSVKDEVVRFVCPDGGSLDETSTRNSVSSALSDFFQDNPDVDIMNLNEDSIWVLISSFLGYEAFNRIQLDIGQAFERLESLVSRVSRLNDMRDYLKSEISSQLNAIRKEIARRTISDLQEIFQKSIERTFSVFEVSL